MASKSSRFYNQLSPWGCFATAVLNAYIYMDLTPPDAHSLIEASGCESSRGIVDKPKLIHSLKGIHFKPASPEQVLKTAGILTFDCRRFCNHSAFFFRRGSRTYAVNANINTDSLVEIVRIREFLKENEEVLTSMGHWTVC